MERDAMQHLPRLVALATAVPPYPLDQAAAVERARHLFAGAANLERLLPVFANSGIRRRYASVPLDWFEEPHGWPERNRCYLATALDLLESATGRALDDAGMRSSEIGAIVVVSTTGIARAATIAAAMPDKAVLLLVVELCSLTFRRGDRAKSNIVAAALFGDGAAAALLRCGGDGPAVIATGEHTWPQTLDIMGWAVAEDGLKPVFSRDIPRLVSDKLGAVAQEFLGRHGLTLADIDRFVCHPGGGKRVVRA